MLLTVGMCVCGADLLAKATEPCAKNYIEPKETLNMRIVQLCSCTSKLWTRPFATQLDRGNDVEIEDGKANELQERKA